MGPRFYLLLLLIVVIFIGSKKLNAQFQNLPPACKLASEFLSVANVYALLNTQDAFDNQREMQSLRARACRGDFQVNGPVTYSNGEIATSMAADMASSWYWPNGNLITTTPSSSTATVYYPNGALLTTSYREIGSTYIYPNSVTITTEAGVAGEAINDLSGVELTSNSYNFSSPIQLDIERFLAYIVDLNRTYQFPTTVLQCTSRDINAAVDRSIDLLQSTQNSMAMDQLRDLKMCL